jgi:hypothetical protein
VGGFRAWETSASILTVIVYSFHVVKEVVSPWEAIARESALAASVEAKVRAVTVAVHAVSLALVAEEASGRRKLLLGASVLPAAEWLEVGINELAVREIWLGTNLWVVGGR